MTQPKRWTFGAAFLSGALLLASCGGGETPQEPQQPTSGDARVIMGDIEPNQDLPTAVNVEALRQSNRPALRDLQAAVDSEGRFTLTLPDAANMNQFEDLQGAGEAQRGLDALLGRLGQCGPQDPLQGLGGIRAPSRRHRQVPHSGGHGDGIVGATLYVER